MANAIRRYPRLSASAPAEVEIRVRNRKHTAKAVMSAVSCEGVGLAIYDMVPFPVPRSSTVSVRFMLGTEQMDLPGRVAWSKEQDDRLDMGIQLRLEMASAGMRQTYARWIVGAINDARRQHNL